MRKIFLLPFAFLFVCSAVMAQQTQPQPLTFYYDYIVKPGQEGEFMELVKTVGAPVRDKLMADGVILAWGIETPVLRYPGGTTHLIWFSVANWGGVDKVLSGMEAQLQKLAAEDARRVESAHANKQKAPMTTAERQQAVFDMSKTRDWLARDLVSNYGPNPPAGTLPVTRYNFIKVKPGMNAEYRRTWEKYNKPVFDKMVADGALLAYGLSTEEVKTDGDFTHFVWMATSDMAGLEKIAAAFAADRARRPEDEQKTIADLFASVTEPDKARSVVTRSRIFRLPAK
ncbi:MAG TPA: hypothetical protein VFI24_28385 [Pyrinomonadaceae bacterium]|nr:hypothetical protein [Pyrinomonadaceae bacterium]